MIYGNVERNKVVLTALGICSNLGLGKEPLSAVFGGDNLSHLEKFRLSVNEKEVLIARVSDRLVSEAIGDRRLELAAKYPQFISRNVELAEICISQISSQIDLLLSKFDPSRIAVVVATSTSGIAEGCEAVSNKLANGSLSSNYQYSQQEIGALSCYIRERLQLKGLSYTISTACSSSAKVFKSARSLIQNDLADAVILGGIDSLSPLTINGFAALELLSDKRCNPFSQNRSGITIGEGGALFIMEKGSDGVVLLGVGESSDAYHPSTPDPTGRGAARAIAAALAEGGVSPSAIDYINLHGTGTIHNDAMESCALELCCLSDIPASSTKSWHGHTLGASGAIEAALCWCLLTRSGSGALPLHLWDKERDTTIPRVNLIDSSCSVAPKTILSNSFGFGGSNCSLLLTV